MKIPGVRTEGIVLLAALEKLGTADTLQLSKACKRKASGVLSVLSRCEINGYVLRVKQSERTRHGTAPNEWTLTDHGRALVKEAAENPPPVFQPPVMQMPASSVFNFPAGGWSFPT